METSSATALNLTPGVFRSRAPSLVSPRFRNQKASGVGPSLARECARTTNSWKEYAEDMHKHVRCKAETTERYAGPVTAAMQFGWNKVDPMRPAFGRKSCEETKIAEGQILGARRP